MKATAYALALLAFAVSGCAKVTGYWPHQWHSTTLHESYFEFRNPEAPVRKTATSSRHTRYRYTHRHRHHFKQVASPAIPVEKNFQPAQALPQPAPTVTLAGEDDGGAPARNSLNDTARQLARVDHAKLSGVNLSTYEEVSGFLRAGRDALSRRDYVAAAGFAQKASSLASGLPLAGQ
ncbi:MAG: hypothetical protein ACREQ4_10695 [Candidatus Binataceae bacterium]